MMNSFEGQINDEHDNHFDRQVALASCSCCGYGGDARFITDETGTCNSSYWWWLDRLVSHFGTPCSQQLAIGTNTQSSSPSYSPVYSSDASLQQESPQYIYYQHPLTGSPTYLPIQDALSKFEIESQESPNEETMLSEPVMPPLDGFPDVQEFDQLMNRYAR